MEAIDAFLAAHRFANAIQVCRKLIRIAPDVVRTRFTLAFLLLGRGTTGEAEQALLEYVEAVRQDRAESFAVPHLRLFAQATDDPRLRAMVSEMLERWGSPGIADLPPGGGIPPPEVRWERLLPIVLRP